MAEFLVQSPSQKAVSEPITSDQKGPLAQFNKATIDSPIPQPNSPQSSPVLPPAVGEPMDGRGEQGGLAGSLLLQPPPIQSTNNLLTIIFEYGMDRIALDTSKQETVRSVKSRIGDILNCDTSEFDLVAGEEVIDLENKMLSHYELENEDVVAVKRKIPLNLLQTGLGAKVKMVESVASSSDHVDQKQRDYSPMLKKKAFNVQKKSSCSASLRNIKDPDQKAKDELKHSSIEPYTMHKNQIDEVQEKENKLLNIEDIKETMSFGSLQESKIEETEAEVNNEDASLYIRFCCPLGCRVGDLKRKISKMWRVSIQQVEILEAEDPVMVEDLSVMGDRIHLTFRINQ